MAASEDSPSVPSASTMPVEGDVYVSETIHEETVPAGSVEGEIGIKQLREAIPAHCFQPSTFRSLLVLAQDLLLIGAIFQATWTLGPHLPLPYQRLLYLVVYPFLVALPATGLWVLGHEAGHGSFSKNRFVAHSVGFFAHSVLLSPYFAWRSTHARHHVYANHIHKDHNYVPPVREEYRELFRGKIDLDHLTADAPVVVLLRIVLQQLIGWPWYMLTNITAGPKSTTRPSKGPWDNSHFDPTSSLFRPDEFWAIAASDVGILACLAAAYLTAQDLGWYTVFWAYFLPVMWVNHFIVMITYLHHTSPELPKYTPEAWTFMRGALATVDRDPGFLLRHLFHHIVDLHVVHHLFPRIPHYYAQEATDAIKPILGKYYNQDKRSWLGALYSSFTDCQWVEPGAPASDALSAVPQRSASDAEKIAEDDAGVLWYKPGPMPAPVTVMRPAEIAELFPPGMKW